MKVKKTLQKSGKLEPIKKEPDQELISHIVACHTAGDNYRKKFKTRWDDIESQIRCQHPSMWDNKEAWQTKVFIPQQAKTSETAQSYLDKMLFGQKRNFSIKGTETTDREEEGYIMDLYDNLFDRGNFSIENDFVLNETCGGPGTSFMKLLVDTKNVEGKITATGIKFIWRSSYNITIDPECGHKLERARFIIDEYKKSLSELVQEVENEISLYAKERVQTLIDYAEEVSRNKSDEAKSTIKGFDGTDIVITEQFKNISLIEYWGVVPIITKNKDGKEIKRYENRIVTLANETIKLRDVSNEYGFLPFYSCRIKPRKYDFYGLGFLDNTVDLQELTNSMINLGFDSLKLCSMDIALVDATKIKDPASIEYKPMAVWMLKGNPNEAVKLGRQGISALTDIMRGLTILDQFQQESTGVLRQIQGAPELTAGGSETLGEYQAKLAMIDNRFLKIARFIERDYFEPMLKGMFKILFNPKFFNQAIIDRILGMKEETMMMPGPIGENIPMKRMVQKLDFNKISQITEMGYDFKAVGMTQFTKALETLTKLKELLLTVVKTPQLMIISKVEEIYKRVLQAAEIQDYHDLIKTDEEIQKIMNQLYGGVRPQGAIASTEGGI